MRYFDTTIKKILNEAAFRPEAGDLTNVAAKATGASLKYFVDLLTKDNYAKELINKILYKTAILPQIGNRQDREKIINSFQEILTNRLKNPSQFPNRGILNQEELRALIRNKIDLSKIDTLRVVIAPFTGEEIQKLKDYYMIEEDIINILSFCLSNRSIDKNMSDAETQKLADQLNTQQQNTNTNTPTPQDFATQNAGSAKQARNFSLNQVPKVKSQFLNDLT